MYKLTPQKPIFKAHKALSRADRSLRVGICCLAAGFIYIAWQIAAHFI